MGGALHAGELFRWLLFFFFIYCFTSTLAVFYSHQVLCYLKLLRYSFTSMAGVILMYTLTLLVLSYPYLYHGCLWLEYWHELPNLHNYGNSHIQFVFAFSRYIYYNFYLEFLHRLRSFFLWSFDIINFLLRFVIFTNLCIATHTKMLL